MDPRLMGTENPDYNPEKLRKYPNSLFRGNLEKRWIPSTISDTAFSSRSSIFSAPLCAVVSHLLRVSTEMLREILRKSNPNTQ